MRKNAVALCIALAAGAAAVWLYARRQSSPPPPENRIPALTKLVAEEEKASAQAVANYHPKNPARIDDLAVPAVEVLRQLPGVAEAEAAVQPGKPDCRIVHLRDWHFVPKELFAIEADGPPEEVDQQYREFLLEVEAVQLEQMALLRCLIRHHGLKRIYCEGLTASDLPNYREKIAVLRKMEHKQIPELRKQLAEVRQLLKDMQPQTERHASARKIESEITAMLDQHKQRLLELGAPGRLLIAGEIDVLPLDDQELLDRAKPVTPEGKVRIDPERLKDRHDAQVKAVIGKGAFALIVLGGAHDLSDSVRRLGRGRCEYIRVTTRRVEEFSR